MVKVISKMGSMEVFYYLMAIDGIEEVEEEQFELVGKEIMGDDFLDAKDEIVSKCNLYLENISNDEERYDVIQEGLDEALDDTVKSIEEGVVPRLLLWDMLTIAMCDSEYTSEENRLISHVARVLKIDKSVFAEMKQLMITVNAVEKEKEQLDSSNRPYNEIRPLVDEIENRKKTIVNAALALIEDDIVLEQDPKETVQEDNAIVNATRVVTEKTSKGFKEASEFVSEKTSKGFKEASSFLSEKTSQGVSVVSEEAGKLFGRLKKHKNKGDNPEEAKIKNE